MSVRPAQYTKLRQDRRVEFAGSGGPQEFFGKTRSLYSGCIVRRIGGVSIELGICRVEGAKEFSTFVQGVHVRSAKSTFFLLGRKPENIDSIRYSNSRFAQLACVCDQRFVAKKKAKNARLNVVEALVFQATFKTSDYRGLT